jgi:hypothetical protein
VNVSTTAKKEADNGQMLYVLLLVWCSYLTTLLIIKGLVFLVASLFLLPTLRSAHFYLKAACYGCCHCHRQLLSSHDTSGEMEKKLFYSTRIAGCALVILMA